jgi:hypothetical protein
MGQKFEPAGFDQLYVLGLDDLGNSRGARFQVLKDSIVSAAMDLNCHVLIRQPDEVSALAIKLPVGHVHDSGRCVTLFIPNIRRELYNKILSAARIAAHLEGVRVGAQPFRIH